MDRYEQTNSHPSAPLLVKRQTMAATLSISVRTLEKLTNNGTLPCVPLSRRCVRFDPVAVREAYRALQTVTVGQEVARRRAGAR